MINVYIRATPQQANALRLWQEDVKAAAKAKGITPRQALRFMPATSARACANALLDAQIIRPYPPTENEQLQLAYAEIKQLQLDPVIFRQRLEEAEIKGRRDREQAAEDLARVVAEREELNDAM